MFDTSVVTTWARSAARYTISLMGCGHASASTQICTERSYPVVRDPLVMGLGRAQRQVERDPERARPREEEDGHEGDDDRPDDRERGPRGGRPRQRDRRHEADGEEQLGHDQVQAARALEVAG